MTRIRDRYDIDVFRQFFETIVARCQAAGLVVGQALYADGTLVEADADRDAMVPRFAVEAYLQTLFGPDYRAPEGSTPDAPPTLALQSEPAAVEATALAQVERLRRQVRARQRKPPVDEPLIRGRFPRRLPPPLAPLNPEQPPLPTPPTLEASGSSVPSDPSAPPELRPDLAPAVRAELEAHYQQRHDWFALKGAPDRDVQRWGYQGVSNFWVSTTDRDATLMRQHGQGVCLRYRTHYIVDGGILQVLVTPSDVIENTVFLDLLWRACFRWQLRPRSATGDATYGTLEIIKALEDAGIRAYMPLTDREPPPPRIGKQGLHLHRCPLKANCTTSEEGRIIQRSFDEAYLERVRAYHQTTDYQRVCRSPESAAISPLGISAIKRALAGVTGT